MKLKTSHMAVLTAFTLAGPASAVVLLTDNFNTAQDVANFMATLQSTTSSSAPYLNPVPHCSAA
jgi:hypothetical protein